jgi:group I intron endonuclease
VATVVNQHRIYLIECVPTGKCYIGSASFIIQRFSRHKTMLRLGTHWNVLMQNAWNKYGEEAFRFIELECVLRQSDLVVEEQRWLDELQPVFNIAKKAGNALGVKHSLESRKARSKILKEYWSVHQRSPPSISAREKISRAQIGRRRCFTIDHCEALSKAAIGRKLSVETKAKIGRANRGKTRVFTQQHKAAIKAAWDKRRNVNEHENHGLS